MNGMVAVVRACSSALASRRLAQLISRSLIFFMVLVCLFGSQESFGGVGARGGDSLTLQNQKEKTVKNTERPGPRAGTERRKTAGVG
jgi:hypothetical protein